MLTNKDEIMLDYITSDSHIVVLAAAYTIYAEISKSKPLSQREFYQKYHDNIPIFMRLEDEWKECH